MYHAHVPCQHCGSLETQAGFDEYTCLQCGHQTRLLEDDGVPQEPLLGVAVPLEVQYAPKGM